MVILLDAGHTSRPHPRRIYYFQRGQAGRERLLEFRRDACRWITAGLSPTSQARIAIDFVDVGMPNYNFDYEQQSKPACGRRSAVGFDGRLSGTGGSWLCGGNGSVHDPSPGSGTGTVHVYVGRVTDVLYPDDDDDDYASAVFAPTLLRLGIRDRRHRHHRDLSPAAGRQARGTQLALRAFGIPVRAADRRLR
ncbi:MAG: hypothetical protein M0C28_36600 [Candidatus Moduliflexus flocculans]|nr:hypothetical protein [Candidatus Moduliflexus flocculans]